MTFHDPATSYAEALENLTEENWHTERALIEAEVGERAIEWAVLQNEARSVRVVKGPFPSREEAEAWRAALDITRRRTNAEHFLATDGIVSETPLFIGSREVTPWGADV